MFRGKVANALRKNIKQSFLSIYLVFETINPIVFPIKPIFILKIWE